MIDCIGPTKRKSNVYTSTQRVEFEGGELYLYAWPSKGGVIVLEHAESIDFEFLELDFLNPPTKRLENQFEEDLFCQRLLLLGAKWWKSEHKWRAFHSAGGDEELFHLMEELDNLSFTMKERRWVSVGWPSTGGLVVTEYETSLWGKQDEGKIVPNDIARIKLARTMDERCQILVEHFKGVFYNDVSEYKGYAFINSWDEKEGEDRKKSIDQMT